MACTPGSYGQTAFTVYPVSPCTPCTASQAQCMALFDEASGSYKNPACATQPPCSPYLNPFNRKRTNCTALTMVNEYCIPCPDGSSCPLGNGKKGVHHHAKSPLARPLLRNNPGRPTPFLPSIARKAAALRLAPSPTPNKSTKPLSHPQAWSPWSRPPRRGTGGACQPTWASARRATPSTSRCEPTAGAATSSTRATRTMPACPRTSAPTGGSAPVIVVAWP
jgi:hypothetical protein